MESCYIPNNPQYGLSLEYTAYNNGASFNGTITGFPSSDPVNDNVLCCSGLLQNCGSCDGELEPLRDCGAHCHLQCDDGLNGDLDDFSNKLDNYDTRLAECGGRLTNCDNLSADELGNCDDHLRACEGRLIDCGDQLGECDDRLVDCDDSLRQCDGQLEECDNSFRDCDNGLRECDGGLECQDALGGCEVDQEGTTAEQVGAAGCWTSDDMGSFSLPSLDLDPLPSLFPFSPCSAGYKGEMKEKQPHEVADVLLSLKHAVVHPGAELAPPYSQQDALHPQMVMGGPGCYDSCGPSVFPTMSVNVSMNMTMHGYPPDQMCPQMQWGQNPSTSPMNVMYSQNQGMLSPAPYPGSATYSFTADFRTPNQSDPLITATSSFKPIQISAQKSAQNIQNYNIFGQKPPQPNFTNLGQKQLNFANNNTSQMKTRSSSKLQLNPEQLGQSSGPTYQILGGQNQGNVNSHGLGFPHLSNGINLQNGMSPGGGKVQIGALSGCSESEDEQKPNLCRICGKTYARPSTLKTHLRTHSGERPYRCSDCNKSFSQAANLTAHVRTHTGQKPFRCPICDRRFSQSSSVTTHMRTHSGERPYRCRACKKAFSDSSTLTKHLRIHSGEKPYQCKLCLLRFSQSGNLNRHMRVHGNNGSILG